VEADWRPGHELTHQLQQPLHPHLPSRGQATNQLTPLLSNRSCSIERALRKGSILEVTQKTPLITQIPPLRLKVCNRSRVSSETSFTSKQPKLEPKLVSALSETKRLFRLFYVFTKTASCGVSIEPKQKKGPTKTQTVNNYVAYNLSKFQIDNIKI